MTKPRKLRITRSLSRNTEYAIRKAVEALPDEVYVSPQFRGHDKRIHVVTTKMPTVQENVERASNADAIGFLIAVMNGQPLPEWRVTIVNGEAKIEVQYATPILSERMLAARYVGMIQNRMNPLEDRGGNEFASKARKAAEAQRRKLDGQTS